MPRADKPLKKKKCKYCKSFFQPQRPLQYLCPPPNSCSWEYVKKKTQEKIERENREETKKLKEKLMSHGDWLQLLRKVFNAYIRKRDEGQPCISCGTTANVRYDAGHFYPTTYSYLRFNEDNVHRQCSNNCNKHKSGNLLEYRPRLIAKIGEDRVKWLDENCHQTLKLSIPEIKEKIIEYRNKIKTLTENT